MLDIQTIKDGIAAAAAEFPIKKAELFGSYASGKNTNGSDVDLLVEFTMPRVSLVMLNQIKYRLEEILQTDVDVIHGPLDDGCMIEIEERIPLYGA